MTRPDYIPAYVNDDGSIWIERGVAPWPRIQHEARIMADEMTDAYPASVLTYEGIVEGVRVSDVEEMPHEDRSDCAKRGCCRTITAHQFQADEP